MLQPGPAAVEAAPHLERGVEPGLDRRVQRRVREDGDRRVEVLVAAPGVPGAEVRRLHRARTAAGHHDDAGAGQRAPEQRHGAVLVGVAGQPVAAHDRHDAVPGQRLLERVRHAVVVQAAIERLEDARRAGAAGGAEVRVDPGVARRRVAARLADDVAGVEILLDRVEAAAERIVGNAFRPRHDQRLVGERVGDRRRLELAAEERRPGEPAGRQRRGVAPQVQTLEDTRGERPAFAQVRVELGDGLELEGRLVGDHGRCSSTSASSRGRRRRARCDTSRDSGRRDRCRASTPPACPCLP